LGAIAYTVAFEGVEARTVEVQCAISPGLPAFAIVGLPDKAVSPARERVRAALSALVIALPPKRITIKLSPADLPKEGSHFDLPIALALLGALEIVPQDELNSLVSIGELSLDGTLVPIVGALPAAMAAATDERGLICPKACGREAAWVASATVTGARSLGEVIRHLTGQNPLPPAEPGEIAGFAAQRDLRDVKGQERAKRALEISAAGRHHMMLIGAPGSGKSMLAARLPGILPPLSPAEALETSMIHSLAGLLTDGGISRQRPFREPHHNASMAAIIGGRRGAKPGEISLAHNGILFLDELPEFSRPVLEALRQPIETGEVVVARANAHVRYPCKFLLVAAANPCRCGHMTDPARACARVPQCGEDYLGRISGPLMDRFDLRIEVPPVAFTDLDLPPSGDPSAIVAVRVAEARALQGQRYGTANGIATNSDIEGAMLEEVATPDTEGREILLKIAEKFGLSARGYQRVLRVARTIADLDGSVSVRRPHVAEAASYRIAFSKVS
jgi:magnesium chelatase family protein